MVSCRILSNLSEVSVIKDHQAHKWAICHKNPRLEAPQGGPAADLGSRVASRRGAGSQANHESALRYVFGN